MPLSLTSSKSTSFGNFQFSLTAKHFSPNLGSNISGRSVTSLLRCSRSAKERKKKGKGRGKKRLFSGVRVEKKARIASWFPFKTPTEGGQAPPSQIHICV